jgi:hypothetical protein
LQAECEANARETEGPRRRAGGPLLQPYCNPTGWGLDEGFVHRPGRGVAHAGQYVAVGVERDGDGVVAQ